MAFLFVALGGAFGSVLRYGVTLGSNAMFGTTWPWGTFFVNVLGSFLLGVVAEAFAGRTWVGVDLRVIFGTGVLGGFTTYSSFNTETLRLAEAHSLGRAGAYCAATVIACLVAGVLGIALVRSLKAPG